MVRLGADRFLDNVLKRSYKDVLVSPLVFLLIIPGCFGVVAYVAWTVSTSWGISFVSLISAGAIFVCAGFVAILALGIIYILARALITHHSRDVDWMCALLGYASNYGKDTSELEKTCDAMSGVCSRRYEFMTLAVFSVFTIVFSFQGFYFDLSEQSDGLLNNLSFLIVALVLVMMSVSMMHNIAVLYLMDDIQRRFTAVFSEVMSEDTELEVMRSDIRMYEIRTHLILLVATLGLYAPILGAIYIGSLKNHIRCQWEYEVKILKWMSKREVTNGIVKRKSVKKTGGWLAFFMRFT